MTPDAELIRVHVWVTGRVQGVGFRAHVEYYGRGLKLNGWVRNVGYDVVETVAEGPRSVVEKFLEVVRQGPRMARVDQMRVEDEVYTAEFKSFEVRRSA